MSVSESSHNLCCQYGVRVARFIETTHQNCLQRAHFARFSRHHFNNLFPVLVTGLSGACLIQSHADSEMCVENLVIVQVCWLLIKSSSLYGGKENILLRNHHLASCSEIKRKYDVKTILQIGVLFSLAALQHVTPQGVLGWGSLCS